MPQIAYENLERHFTAPKDNTAFSDSIRIPRKLKKKVRRFCGVHWSGKSNGVRLWYYLEKANNNYKRFFDKTSCQIRIKPKIHCLNPECQEDWREDKPLCMEGFVDYKKLCANFIDGESYSLIQLKSQYYNLTAKYNDLDLSQRDSNFGIGIYREMCKMEEQIKSAQP